MSDNPTILNNIEWQVLREALDLWRTCNKTQMEAKKSASFSLEEKIEGIFIKNMKEQKI